MKYKQLTIEEREQIQEMLWQKRSIRAIAEMLGCNPSTIVRELQRNKSPERGKYTPRLAQKRALANRKHRGREERLKHKDLRDKTFKTWLITGTDSGNSSGGNWYKYFP